MLLQLRTMSVCSLDEPTWAIGPAEPRNLLNLHDSDPQLWVNEWRLTVNSPPPSPIAAEGSLTPNLQALGVLDDVPLLRLPPAASPSLFLIQEAEKRLEKAEYTLQVYKDRLQRGTFHRVKTYKEKLLKTLEFAVIDARRELLKATK
jgi:hypothetical protein